MKKIIWLFTLLPFFIWAESDLFFPDEDLSLFNHVNVISGQLNLCFQDGAATGAKTLPIIRTYSSAGALERAKFSLDKILKKQHGGWLVQGGWSLFPHADLLINPGQTKKDIEAFVAERSGAIFPYYYSHQKGDHIIYLKTKRGSSQTGGTISGRRSIQNNLLQIDLKQGEATLFAADGSTLNYVGPHLDHYKKTGARQDRCYFRLVHETLPSRHIIEYSYDDKPILTAIALKNPAASKVLAQLKFNFIKTKTPFHFQIETSDGKTFTYKAMEFKERDYLSTLQSSCHAEESVHYVAGRKGTGARIESFVAAGRTQFHVSYYLPKDKKKEKWWARWPEDKDFHIDKVSELKMPAGSNGEMVSVARFSYKPNLTEVRDADNLLIRYHHDGEHLTRIDYFAEKDRLASSLRFFWEKNRLKGKVMFDGAEKPLFSKTFQYNSDENVTEETFWGNLTGAASSPFTLNSDGSLKGAESLRKRYTYLPSFNVLASEEEEGGLTYRYIYKSGTDLVSAKFTCDGTAILVREFSSYDDDNLLISEIVDNGASSDEADLSGVTFRRIKRYQLDPSSGLTKKISELYWDSTTKSEKLLQKTELTYSPQNLVIAEDVYDAEGVRRYTLTTDYDAFGRVIRKTTPLGQENLTTYNTFGRPEEIKEVGTPKKIYLYNAMDRPISFREMEKTSHFAYDTKGRLLSKTEPSGATTFQAYDAFGRCIQTRFPKTVDEDGNPYTPSVQFSYDIQGNIASTTNPKNETTQTFYNAYRNPIRIVHADKTETLHLYNKEGTLKKTTYADGTTLHYTYDLFQRTTSKKSFSASGELLGSEEWVYDKNLLLSFTDANGLTTLYQYDSSGRKIAEKSQERETHFLFDALGYIEKRTEGSSSHTELHDEGGRIISVWDEDESSGQIENRMHFFYNAENQKIKATRLTSQGEATDLFTYDSEGRLSSHRDPYDATSQFLYCDLPSGLQKTTIDPIGNITIDTYDTLNHLVSSEKKTPEGETIIKENRLYDRAGNLAKLLSTISVSWEYDSMGRVIKEREADSKTTLFAYDSRGRLIRKILPRGISLSYAYDGLGRLIEMESSDGTIHYQYVYDQGPDPIAIFDLLQKIRLERSYNLFGEVVTEKNLFGSFFWEYDTQGRCTQFTLPDHSSIAYTYDGLHMRSVKRSFYEHRYTVFDENGHVAEEELIADLGTISTLHDLMERPSFQRSSWLEQKATYGPSGLVVATGNTLLGSENFAYDALNQLTEEGEERYQFDPLGNPTNCTINPYNQIVSSPQGNFEYDLDGNPIFRTTSEGTTAYTYDALGRLTSITHPDGKKVVYHYDPLSRLYSKSTAQDVRFFLYDKEVEIGSIDSQGNLIEFKICGLGIKGEVGASVAMEIDGELFAPLHDFAGNVIALISAQKSAIVETYTITAFGKESASSTPSSPWRFVSKRCDEGLVFFGKRFYDPSLGRWLTPDPTGFTDGPNLYAYTHNTPSNRLDLFGLNSEKTFPPPRIGVDIPLPIPIDFLSMSNLIHSKGSIEGSPVDWIVACGHWHQLQFSPTELEAGYFNMVDHLSELVPDKGQIVGLISAQNGITTSLDSFTANCQGITGKVPEGTLFLGLYNPTRGLISDLRRFFSIKGGKETSEVILTRQFLSAIVDQLDKINPEILWLHIPHSESGAIDTRAIEGMLPDTQEKLLDHLYVYALGPGLPLSKKLAFEAINIYSEKDHITKRFSHPYAHNSDYNIQIIPSLSKWSDKVGYWADHSFLSPTYQGALKDEFNNIRRFHGGFYENKPR